MAHSLCIGSSEFRSINKLPAAFSDKCTGSNRGGIFRNLHFNYKKFNLIKN